MRFLNDVTDEYPHAISFAPGRPAEQFFDLDSWLATIPLAHRHMPSDWHLGQYGSTAGFITELVARQLRHDEGIDCTPERVLITAGCQEALALCLPTLCAEPGDVLLVRNPTYIGATGIARLSNIDVVAIEPAAEDELAAAVQSTVARVRASGRTVRALYVIPQFDNPTGGVLPTSQRRALLSVCTENSIVILEDNPYGMYCFDGEAEPALAALDEGGCVVYLATYSKTLCPAVRTGCAVVPKTLFGDAAAAAALMGALLERKSIFTLNTSPLNQAVVGGVLLSEGGTLRRIVEAPRAHYRRNRDLLLTRLGEAFPNGDGVRWNRPRGGFFLSLEFPFAFGPNELVECAAKHGVILTPMSFFALDDSQQQRVRIAFSNLTPEQIERGIAAVAQYVRTR